MPENLSVRPVERAVLLDDLHIRSDGSGRIVEAYAAVFRNKTEIFDQDGHYNEDIDPAAFNRTLSHKGTNFGVLFNHARTVDGEPNPLATMPIGVPIEVKADERGLFTATRYLNNPLADDVLDGIKHGAFRAQSFSGRFMRSARSYPDGRGKGKLPAITRHEIDMREYGPAVFAAYPDAAILGTRSLALAMRTFLALPEEERLEWAQQFEVTSTPVESDVTDGTPGNGRADEADSGNHSAREEIAAKLAAFRQKHSPRKDV
jgi:HK97 family phage prohead protease